MRNKNENAFLRHFPNSQNILRTEICSILIQGYIHISLHGERARMVVYLDILRNLNSRRQWADLKTVWITGEALCKPVCSMRGISTARKERTRPAITVGSKRLRGGALANTKFDPHNNEAEHDPDDRTCCVDGYELKVRFRKIWDIGCECENAECLLWDTLPI